MKTTESINVREDNSPEEEEQEEIREKWPGEAERERGEARKQSKFAFWLELRKGVVVEEANTSTLLPAMAIVIAAEVTEVVINRIEA